MTQPYWTMLGCALGSSFLAFWLKLIHAAVTCNGCFSELNWLGTITLMVLWLVGATVTSFMLFGCAQFLTALWQDDFRKFNAAIGQQQEHAE